MITIIRDTREFDIDEFGLNLDFFSLSLNSFLPKVPLPWDRSGDAGMVRAEALTRKVQ